MGGRNMPGQWDTLTVDGSAMRCYVSAPAGPGPFPALVVIQHAGGVDDFVRTMTDRFAGAGHLALPLAPALYHREDPVSTDDPLTRMARLRDVSIVKDVSAAVEHLKTLPSAAADS